MRDLLHGRLQRLWAIVFKEIIQTIRDWPKLLMIIMLPILELFLVAYMGDMQMEHIPMAVADLSLDTESRRLVAGLESSNIFDAVMAVDSEAAVLRAIDEGTVYAGLVIPADLASAVERGDAQVLILVDGSDSFVVQSSYVAAASIAQVYGIELMMDKVQRMGMDSMIGAPIVTSARILYNPNMDSLIFLIPGLAAILLQLISVNVTAMSVVREREHGTMEQILVTPTRPLELILGKMTPGILLVGIDLTIIIALGLYWFEVPFRGSIGLFIWLSMIFIVSGLGLGLLISTVASSQKHAQQQTSVLMLLTMMLTGLLYPRSTMPPVVQAVGSMIPATYFVRIARGIVTKGVGITFLWRDVVVLVIYGVVILAIASGTFKKRLD
ncbi:MAG: ABC transporter permease [Anaerolineae bacterium]|nr:ABC transporter permease [Anaerolineae bacterium]